MNITFNELREIKDKLPDGTMGMIAERLGIEKDTVRNYFGGANYNRGNVADLHYEQGPNGGIVHIEDPSILEMAKTILAEQSSEEE